MKGKGTKHCSFQPMQATLWKALRHSVFQSHQVPCFRAAVLDAAKNCPYMQAWQLLFSVLQTVYHYISFQNFTVHPYTQADNQVVFTFLSSVVLIHGKTQSKLNFW